MQRAAAFFDRRTDREIDVLTMGLGTVLGALVSLSSVGAGAMGVTALLMLYPKMPTVRVVGSDIAHAVPLTLIASVGHWWLNSVDWALLLSLLIGSTRRRDRELLRLARSSTLCCDLCWPAC